MDPRLAIHLLGKQEPPACQPCLWARSWPWCRCSTRRAAHLRRDRA